MNRNTLATSQPHIDTALAVLHAQKGIWVALGLSERVCILDEVRADMLAVADRWIAAGLTAKGLAAHTIGEAEEWLFLAAILRAIRMVRQSLTEIQRDGRPRLPGPIARLTTGQLAVRVFPRDSWDRLLFGGVTGDVWMQPGVTVEALLHSQARHSGHASAEQLPWTVIPDLDPTVTDDVAFTREAFCSIIAETALESEGVVDFIEQAVTFANTTLWGTLNATLIVHPASLRDPQVAAAVDRAIAHLRYGAVTVNMAAFAAYYFQVTPWGGFPGHSIDDIQSGIGKNANFLMFEHPQKSVVRGPFRKRFDPLRVTARQAHTFARRLASVEALPSLWNVARLIGTALRA